MNTQIKNYNNVEFLSQEDEYKIKLYVIYASSQAVDYMGMPLEQIPIDFIEDDASGHGVARAMVAASEIYTAADGWSIERVDADAVSDEDMARLGRRLSENYVWDEYIGLPDGVCPACGGTGYLTRDEFVIDSDGQCEIYEMRGDCAACDSTGSS